MIELNAEDLREYMMLVENKIYQLKYLFALSNEQDTRTDCIERQTHYYKKWHELNEMLKVKNYDHFNVKKQSDIKRSLI